MGEVLSFTPGPASRPGASLGEKAKLIALAPRRAVKAMRAERLAFARPDRAPNAGRHAVTQGHLELIPQLAGLGKRQPLHQARQRHEMAAYCVTLSRGGAHGRGASLSMAEPN